MNLILRISRTIAWLVSLSIAINLVIITAQIFIQKSHKEFYIKIGYPYDFYYLTESFEIHGVSDMNNFIYDGFLTLVIVTIILIFLKWFIRKFLSKNNSTEVLDSEK